MFVSGGKKRRSMKKVKKAAGPSRRGASARIGGKKSKKASKKSKKSKKSRKSRR